MFPPTDLPSSNEFLLITDQLSSPADFLVHKFLASHFKKSKEAKCLLLSLSESVTRWKVLAGKMVCRAPVIHTKSLLMKIAQNVNLTQHISSGSLVFLDGKNLPAPSASHNTGKTELRPLFDLVRFELDKWAESGCRTLVMIDDVSVLEWIGFSVVDISRFIRALYAACRKV